MACWLLLFVFSAIDRAGEKTNFGIRVYRKNRRVPSARKLTMDLAKAPVFFIHWTWCNTIAMLRIGERTKN